MPKRLRYTQVLGLNTRGLTRHQKRQIVWKEHVKDKLPRSIYVKPTPQKRQNAKNEYWDKYHDEEQRFEGMGLKEFLSNPSIITKIPQKRRKIIYSKLRNAQMRIEYFKYKYSVSIPDKNALKILSMLAKGQGIVQMKTSNHCNGYWSYLLSQRNIPCKVFDANNQKHLESLSNTNNHSNVWKNKKKNKNSKNLPKSKARLAQEAKEWISILNKDSTLKIEEILKDYSKYVLLMIYPDFMMDQNVINQIVENKNNKIDGNADGDAEEDDLNDFMLDNDVKQNAKYESFGDLMVDNKVSVECLKRFQGNYVVHVGELFGCTHTANNNPWGRTTSMQFQIELQTHFHKIYEYEMCRWPMFRDTLTVWRRNKIINVGQEKVVCLQQDEINDSFNTKFWKNLLKQRKSKKDGSDKNIFSGANYAPNKQKHNQ